MKNNFSLKINEIYQKQKESKNKPKYLETIKEIIDLDKKIRGD